MLQRRREPDFPLEAFGREHGTKFRRKDLEHDLTMELELLGQIDPAHAAAPKLTLDAIAGAQTVLEDVEEVRVHGEKVGCHSPGGQRRAPSGATRPESEN